MSIILFLIILAVLVLIHEFGHFAAAKQAGIRVDEFGLGFPPKIAGVKKGETEYTINAIPFGGFVKIFGETPDEESLTGPDSHRSLVKKSKWKQIVVISAGVTMNFFFAWFLFAISFMSGFPISVAYNPELVENPHTTITKVFPNTPADYAGLQAGDVISGIAVHGTMYDAPALEAVSDIIQTTKGEDFVMHLERGGEVVTQGINAIPLEEGEKITIGIIMDEIGTLQLGPVDAVIESGKWVFNMSGQIAVGLVGFLKDIVIGKADYDSVSGPVGIAGLVHEARGFGFAYILSFTAFISLHLAILNLLPFPALDGGRLLFIVIEAVFRRPIPTKAANIMNAAGFLLLLGLMVLVTVKDISNLF